MEQELAEPEKPRVVIYDFDMTCVDTSGIHTFAENKTIDLLKKEGYIPEDEENSYDEIINSAEYQDKKGYIIKKKKETILEIASNSHEIIEKYNNNPQKMTCDEQKIMSMLSNMKIYDGLTETWDSLKNEGFEVAICTNAHSEYFELVCKMTGLDKSIGQYDVTIVTANDYKNGKPNPEPIEKVINKLEEKLVNGANIIIVGDDEKDISSVRNYSQKHEEHDCRAVLFAPDSEIQNCQDENVHVIKSHYQLIDLFLHGSKD